MSAMLAPVVEPHLLGAPPYEQMREVLPNLQPEGTAKFLSEVLEAIDEAQTANDLRPVREVIEAWYATLLVLRSVGPDELDRVLRSKASGPTLTTKEVNVRLGQK